MLDSVLPNEDRRSLWSQFGDGLQLKLPDLVRPGWLVVVLYVLTMALTVAAFALAVQSMHIAMAICLGFLAMIACGLVAFWVTQPFATVPASSFRTLGDLSRIVLAENYATMYDEYKSWNPNEVWQALSTIIIDQLGAKPEQVTRDARFAEDLRVE